MWTVVEEAARRLDVLQRLAAMNVEAARRYECWSGSPLRVLKRLAATNVKAARRYE